MAVDWKSPITRARPPIRALNALCVSGTDKKPPFLVVLLTENFRNTDRKPLFYVEMMTKLVSVTDKIYSKG